MRRLLRALPLWIAAGCAASGSAAPTSDVSTAGTATTKSDTTTTAADSGPAEPAPAWYALDAQLRILDGGDLDPAASAVQVSLWSETVDELCVQDLPILGAVAAGVPTSEAEMLGWWEIELDDGASDGTCPSWPSRTYRLGFGPYDVRLDAAVAQHGWDGATLLGFYLEEFADGPLYVVGIAGTVAMFSGDDLPATEPPLAEGRYDARALLLLPL